MQNFSNMNIIYQLPDSIASQIAAGEVVQRPASVLKELLENAVDAKATNIQVTIIDSGRTLIQVSDNGTGMTEVDARMAFERHATSKIRTTNDLFNITTMGFRGEALASIAAVSNVNLKTRRKDDELGTHLEISASTVKLQEPVQCSIGSLFGVKNLFFNVPARRKFLKADQTEFKHLTDEFCRVAIINPNITFTLTHNNQTIYTLTPGNFKQRIVGIFGRQYSENLINIECKTELVELSGFIGNPKFAKKQNYDQFFFVNNRFMRHPYFNKAVQNAFEKIIPAGTSPSYFIHFKVNPETIDVNIHPTKTEIKFENERDIWQILHATVKESLGKFNFVPSIDFDYPTDIPQTLDKLRSNTQVNIPNIRLKQDYNPFETDYKSASKSYNYEKHPAEKNSDWLKILSDFDNKTSKNPEDDNISEEVQHTFIQIKKRFILTSVKSGIMLIDQHRAHFQILFEELQRSFELNRYVSQPLLFPQNIEFDTLKSISFDEIIPKISKMGFKIEKQNNFTYNILAVPAILPTMSIISFFEQLIDTYQTTALELETSLNKLVAQNLASVSAIQYGKDLNREEMCHITDKLFACKSPNYTEDGKIILQIITVEEITNRFNI